MEAAITSYRFNDVAQTLYQFVWHEFCDWYLEMIKPDLTGNDPVAREQAQTCLWDRAQGNTDPAASRHAPS